MLDEKRVEFSFAIEETFPLINEATEHLDFLLSSCYTIPRCKARNTQGLSGLPAVTAVKCAVCSRPSTRKTKLKENEK